MRCASFSIVQSKPGYLLLQDVGPWDKFPTITNSAEEVVIAVANQLNGRRLFYLDSEADPTELLVKNGEFAGFAPATWDDLP